MKGNRLRPARWWLALGAAGLLAGISLKAQTNPAAPPHPLVSFSVTNLIPPPPQSPVAVFRQLLAMTPQERAAYLSNRPPIIREHIQAKIREYLALDPNERELRLRATELRWYLTPLLHQPPADRAAALAHIPQDMRNLVQSRLAEWDALPEQMRREFLDNEAALRYFAGINPGSLPPTTAQQSHWAALPETERQKIIAQFNQFFELTPAEKQEALQTLSETERAQMEKTLQTFNALPPAQRAQCIRAFAEFAGMSPAERAEFLKNAQRWSQMTPRERQAWRDLVAQVPLWPPLPPRPPSPPSSHARALATTNDL
jgi:hypothetical protein